MNKYQKIIFANEIYTYACYVADALETRKNYCKNHKAIDEEITIKQDEDITINDYILISLAPFEYCIGEKWFKSLPNTDCPNKYFAQKPIFFTLFSFDNPITCIRAIDKLALVDSLEIPVICELADKEAYYARKEQERIQSLINAASIKHATGQDLINIRFKNCCEEVAYTKIKLFDDGKQLMGEYKVDDGMFFKTIGGLAYGKYYYKLSQFNNKNNLIIETDYIEFHLS